jgi:coenzyme F420-dependent glucose-6-phosphate dehydrogenase
MTNLAIGYKASAEQFAPSELVDLSVLAEERGMESVWVSDHFQPWRDQGGHAPSAIPFLAAVGARTNRVLLGTSVLTPTLRYNPAVIAQSFATLGCLSPGRIILGVGTGEAMNEHAVSGTAFPEFKERYARLREALTLIRGLWTGERTSFDGSYYRTVDAKLYDLPNLSIPIYIAAGGPQMAKYAGRAGDGIICTSGKGMDLYTDRLLPAAAEGRAAASNSAERFGRMIEIKLSYDRDPARALENTRFWAPLSLTAEEKHGLTDSRDIEKAADALPIEQVARRWIVASDPDTAMAGIQPYIDAGLTHLVFHAPGADQQRFLDQFTEDILPHLRRRLGAPDPFARATAPQ